MNERLKHALNYRGITAYKIEKETKIGRSLIGKYISGESEPSVSNIRLLADYLDISIEWLITGKGEMLKFDTVLKSELDIVDYKEKYYKALEEKDTMYKQLVKALQKALILNEKIQLLNDKLGDVKNELVKQASAVMDVLSERSAS